MKIAFCSIHSYWQGLSDNGGSRTIIKSCEALRKLGHKAFVVTHRDRYTWEKHRKPEKKIPKDADVCVAVSINDIIPMLKKAPKKARKAVWLRGMERWTMPIKKIYSRLQKFSQKHLIMCNSGWLIEDLAAHGISSKLVYSGLDVDFWCSNPAKRPENKIRIGCLYHTMPTKKWKDFKRLIKILGQKNYEFVAFGNRSNKSKKIRKFRKQPSPEKLRELYQSCHIWFAPTKLEGFHNPPAEAALCGCLVVGRDHVSNGMSDYLHSSTGHLFTDVEGAAKAVRNPEWNKVMNMQNQLKEFIGNRETNMQKMVNILKGGC